MEILAQMPTTNGNVYALTRSLDPEGRVVFGVHIQSPLGLVPVYRYRTKWAAEGALAALAIVADRGAA